MAPEPGAAAPRRARRERLALLAVVLLHLLPTWGWLAADAGIQYTDAAFHYSQVLDLREALLGEGTLEELRATDERQRYGGLAYAVAAAVSVVTGAPARRLLAGLALLLVPLVTVGTWRLGRELASPGNEARTGLLAALLVGWIPGVFDYWRVFVLDGPLTAAVLWTGVFLLAALRADAERPQAPGPHPGRGALLAAAAAAMAALAIKLNALAYLLGPAWVVARPTLTATWRRGGLARAGLLGAVLGLPSLAAALLLGGRRGEAISRTVEEATWPGALLEYARRGVLRDAPGHWLAHVRDHSWDVVFHTVLTTLTPVLSIAGAVATAWFFARRQGCHDALCRRQRDLAFWWAVPAVVAVIFLLRGLYDERYVLPALPLLAAVGACALLDLPARRRSSITAVALLAIGLNAAVVSFPVLPALRGRACLVVPGWAPASRSGPAVWVCPAYPEYRFLERTTFPEPVDATTTAIERRLGPERTRRGAPLRAVFLDDVNTLFYRLFQRDLHRGEAGLFRHQDALLVHQCWDEAWMTAVFETPVQVERMIGSADLVVMRYGTPDRAGDEVVRGRRCRVFWRQAENFVLGGTLDQGDGTEVRFYLRTGRAELIE